MTYSERAHLDYLISLIGTDKFNVQTALQLRQLLDKRSHINVNLKIDKQDVDEFEALRRRLNNAG